MSGKRPRDEGDECVPSAAPGVASSPPAKRGRAGAAAGAPASPTRTGAAPSRRKREKADTSLFNLTLQFGAIMQAAGTGPVDLNRVASQLGVRKRRVYDITNVLEGIDLIVPASKNIVTWRSHESERDRAAIAAEVAQLEAESAGARREEEVLRSALEELQGRLTRRIDRALSSSWSFLTHEDVRELPGLDSSLVFAVDGRAHQVWIRSKDGPIDLFFITPLAGVASSIEQPPAGGGQRGPT
ncbi:hypothetical protein FNF28_03854 [Cafeteria roenbergensis]|uniref:E2F/DP family winged-helix DNA-binding domain-containing protein n=1 Tax=Cafeteria roenbergensis TaxID=33653 RepID=A0A5A8DG88_CAFRO|nr:hypothetical protein FNF28_03854 [Cafeteria roenbergensis]